MVYSQQSAEARLERSIKGDLDPAENTVIGSNPMIGVVPRLDVIARFLGERTKFSRIEFSKRTSSQPSVDDCMRDIANEVIKRMRAYRAKK